MPTSPASPVPTAPGPGPADRTRGHKKKDRTRRRLIDAAIDVIAERGEGFSVSDITSHAGVSNGTFYNYFEDRDGLIQSVLADVITAFADSSAQAVGPDDPAVRFATITALALRRAAELPDEVRVVLRLDAAHRAVVDGGGFDHLRADLVAGAATGRFDVEVDAATLDVVVGAILLATRRVADGAATTAYPVRVVTQLLRMLGVSPAEAHQLASQAVDATAAATAG